MTLSEERLRHMLAHIGPPSADLAVSYRTDELHSILTELLSRRASYLDARMRKGADEFAAILTADMTRALPGDIMDDSTYEQIEGALDAADAPIRDVNGRFFTLAERIRSALSLRSDAHTKGEVTEYDPDAPPDHSADNAADFIFKHLSDALGVDGKWSVADGTETWDGDVAGTLYNILIAAGIWDDENGQLAGPIAWLVGWDENPYGMFARTETEANHVIANLNAYAKGVRTNLRAKPLFASPALSLGHPIQGEAVSWPPAKGTDVWLQFKVASHCSMGEPSWVGLANADGGFSVGYPNRGTIFASPQPPTPAGVSATELQLLMRLRDNQQSNVHDVVEGDADMWALGKTLSDRGLLAMVSHPKGVTFHITRLGIAALAAAKGAGE